MNKIDEVRQCKTGDKIRLFNQRQRFCVKARDGRFVILSKPCFGKSLYTIFDFEEGMMGLDNCVFGDTDYNSETECENALVMLNSNEKKVSRRHGLSFEKYMEVYGG